MSAVIWLLSAACYGLGWLVTARRLYGNWRAKGIDGYRERNSVSGTHARARAKWDRDNRAPVMTGALGLALIWPLIPIAVLVIRFMDSAPQLSQAEMRDRIGERDRRIAELEREAGVTP